MGEWWAVVTASGALVSLGTSVADPLPAGLEALRLAEADSAAIRDEARIGWDPGTRSVVILPPLPEVTGGE